MVELSDKVAVDSRLIEDGSHVPRKTFAFARDAAAYAGVGYIARRFERGNCRHAGADPDAAKAAAISAKTGECARSQRPAFA
jgi:hypothetical protein